MKLNYYLKKIQNLILKKNYNYPKTIIDYFYRNKKITVISFSSIGRGRKYIQQNEFFNLTKKYNVMFVKDITRSWLNNVEINQIRTSLKNNNNYAIGHSMGAFNAITFSTLHPIKKVIAFSPQYSIHPKISKDDTFLNFAANITKWKFKKLKFSDKTNYLLIFGDSDKEKYHMSMIPKRNNIKLMVLKKCNHNTAPHLKKLKKLDKTINKFFLN
jgi:S-formylglutathione hydrolase FrmB